MAEEEPQLKKLKHSVISDFIYSTNFQQLFFQNWHSSTDIKIDNLEIISKPFRVCRISNFLCSEEFMDEIKNELLDVKSRRNSIDLYQFEQTNDLANIDTENLKLLYQTFQIDLATWMERNTKIELNKKISMSSSCYYDTDYLLCHDDNMGDRRIAFILYLSKNWFGKDGGTLDLFDTDEHGLPRNVVKSLIPEYNSLVFFEVVNNSYHQVAEVTTPDKSRWSINGWFHGPLSISNRPPRPEIELDYIQPSNERVNLNDWVTECYLFPGIVKEIQQDMEEESFAFLSNFLRDDVYEKLATDLTSDVIVWKKVGPADTRNYEIAEETSLPELLKTFYNMFKSITMFQLLKNYTELDLVPEKENMNPKMVIELQRWSRGCYTLICDKTITNESTLSTSEQKSNNGRVNQNEETQEDSLETLGKSSKGGQEKSIPNNENKSTESGCDTPVSGKEDDDIDEDEILKKILKSKSPRSKKKNLWQQSSSSKLENLSPQKPARILDTDDSDVSDIGDYLSDPLDCSLECSDQEEDMDDANTSEPGALDMIIQFHTNHVSEEDTIDYVDPKEQEGALIHVPAKDNHLCLVYKTLGTCRVHKYVNHYCTDYFYNLICTYYE
ncbi:2-oxoglutarate and iron-dependent oxygenase domain-containing protein 1 [Eufriesea mexicana]|uniref:prolyl 3-hydroxylase OGFOD1 n=1 Tax=Eufriesea mexicana TaxID=516756 RepID=UPI00083C0496|nr:PREDICTED: prolyl 3-hydroxylase OGFOD1 [Eufriesea mexicana]OAD61014.1 2-oxoglutarate and iron-dependent oxygenase domain-containing protein 1 [Eufriesea mexicana]